MNLDNEYEKERSNLLNLLEQVKRSPEKHSDNYQVSLFLFQYKYNEIYRNYCINLGINVDKIHQSDQIPYLPIGAFKNHIVKTGVFDEEEIFMSSGTTATTRSRHFIRDVDFYKKNTEYIWTKYFRPLQDYCFLALLPGYLERDGSSLISMVDYFIGHSNYSESGFYLRDHDNLYRHIRQCQRNNIPVVLFGVTYALLDFTEQYSLDFPELIIMETGGMKGKRKELTKDEVHRILRSKTGTDKIYSEYGMTELLSQSYTKGGSVFIPNPMMIVHTREINDPLSSQKHGKTGIICVADLANIDSCSFIQTEDQGISYADGRFEIKGRLDASEMRGCNLLMDELGL